MIESLCYLEFDVGGLLLVMTNDFYLDLDALL